jgi:DNA primase small subunit
MNQKNRKDISLRYVHDCFTGYYVENYENLCLPQAIKNREFAFLLLKEQIMLRHKAFKEKNEFFRFLKDNTPSDVYYSSAYYADPSVAMEEKTWLGSDLIFDIDADHIPIPCDKIHDKWVCHACGFSGKGITPQICPICSSQKFHVKTWLCDTCLKHAKQEAIKLLEMLLQDFGFTESEISLYFSGHRGYHIHVESENTKMLHSIERKEIVDYVLGLGINLLFTNQKRKVRWGRLFAVKSTKMNFGWSKRLVQGVSRFVLNSTELDLSKIGLPRNVVDAILKNKTLFLRSLINPETLNSIKGVGVSSLKKIAEYCVSLQSAKVDSVVTTDIHRLIRMSNTLHGKTGFKKTKIPISKIEEFDPFKEAIALKADFVSLFAFDAPEFRIGDGLYGPYKNQTVELPTAAAVLLICKGRAEVLKQDVC